MRKVIVLFLVLGMICFTAMAEDITLTVDVDKMIIPAVIHYGGIPLDEEDKPVRTDLEHIELWIEDYLQRQELRFRKAKAGNLAKNAEVKDVSAVSIKK